MDIFGLLPTFVKMYIHILSKKYRFCMYILGLYVHFVATLPTFCPSFPQKVGRICTYKMVFCTYKIKQKVPFCTYKLPKIDVLYVHFGFVCTFCGQKPTFFFYLIMIKSLYILYRFGEKSGFPGRNVHTRYFCTYKRCIYDRKAVCYNKTSMNHYKGD